MTLQEIKERLYPTPTLDALAADKSFGKALLSSEYSLDIVEILSSEWGVMVHWKIDKPFWEEALTGVFDKEDGPGFIEIMVGGGNK